VLCRVNQRIILQKIKIQKRCYLLVIDLQHRFCIFLRHGRVKVTRPLRRDEGHNRSQAIEPDVPNRFLAYACVCSLHI